MNTRPFEELLQGYLERSLSEEECRELAQDLAASDAHRLELAYHQALDSMLHQLDAPALDKNVILRALPDVASGNLSARVAHEIGKGTTVRLPSRSLWRPLLALAASLAIVAGVWWFSQRQAAGLGLRVAEVQRSEVRVQRAEGKNVPAVVGMELRQGDRVAVWDGGTVTLKYDGEETTIELQGATATFGSENGAKRVRLDGGKLVCSAAPQKKAFRIETPHADAEVVGTRFSLDVASATTLQVQEGTVALCRGDERLLVSAGQTATASNAGGMDRVPAGKRFRVYAWGRNDYGALGIGSWTDSPLPMEVTGVADVIAVAGGKGHTLAVQRDGCVWAWGENGYGQIGDGTYDNRFSPVPVKTADGAQLSGIIGVAARQETSVAIKSDGTIWIWGRDATRVPTQLPGLSNVVSVAAGMGHCVALRRDGTVWTWGSTMFGALGIGSDTTNDTPRQVRMPDGKPLSGVMAVAAGREWFSAALKSDGTLLMWGRNHAGQLGDGTTTDRRSPAPVPGLTDVIAISAGEHHMVALRRDHTVWTWGSNASGQPGDGTTTARNRAAPAPGLTGVIAVAAGCGTSFAVKSDGSLWAWGYNICGQLGDGTTVNRLAPTLIKLSDGAQSSRVSAVAPGYNHTVVLVEGMK